MTTNFWDEVLRKYSFTAKYLKKRKTREENDESI